jgi:hypothetical protein
MVSNRMNMRHAGRCRESDEHQQNQYIFKHDLFLFFGLSGFTTPGLRFFFVRFFLSRFIVCFPLPDVFPSVPGSFVDGIYESCFSTADSDPDRGSPSRQR